MRMRALRAVAAAAGLTLVGVAPVSGHALGQSSASGPAGPLPRRRGHRRGSLVRRDRARRPASVRAAVLSPRRAPEVIGRMTALRSRRSAWSGGSARSWVATWLAGSAICPPCCSGSAFGSACQSRPPCSATPGPRSARSAASSRSPSGDPLLGFNQLDAGLPYPTWLARWPAVLLLFAGLWAELVLPASYNALTVANLLVGYTVLTLAGMALFGRVAWLRNAELFEVLLGWFGRIGPIGVEACQPISAPSAVSDAS